MSDDMAVDEESPGPTNGGLPGESRSVLTLVDVVNQLRQQLDEQDRRHTEELIKQGRRHTEELNEQGRRHTEELNEQGRRHTEELDERLRRFTTVNFLEPVKIILRCAKKSKSLVPVKGGYEGHILEAMSRTEVTHLKHLFRTQIRNVSNELIEEYLCYLHQFWFTCPFKIDDEEERKRSSTSTHQNSKLIDATFRNVNPLFKGIRKKFIFERFNHLQRLLLSSINKNSAENYRDCLDAALRWDPGSFPKSNEAGVRRTFVNFLNACTDVFSVTGLHMETEEEYSVPLKVKKDTTHVRPDIVITYEDKPLLVFEVKHSGLGKFVKADHKLDFGNSDFQKILKQCNTYMYAMELPHIFLTDFRTTILLRLNITKQQSASASDGDLPTGYEYRIINNYHTPITLQAVVTSMLLNEFGVQATKGEFKFVPQAVKDWLEKRSVRRFFKAEGKFKENQVKRFGDFVWSQETRNATESENALNASMILQKIMPDRSGVDSKMFEPIKKLWTSQDNIQKIRVGEEYLSNIFSFTFNENWDEHRLKSIPSSGSRLILKMYNLGYEKVPSNIPSFCSDVLALTAISTHNELSEEKIGVPEVYDYGILTSNEDPNIVYSGFFILMSYVEDQEDEMDVSAIEKAEMKIYEDLKKLQTIGIEHGDIKRDNMRYNETNPMPIDYSHASSLEIQQMKDSFESVKKAVISQKEVVTGQIQEDETASHRNFDSENDIIPVEDNTVSTEATYR